MAFTNNQLYSYRRTYKRCYRTSQFSSFSHFQQTIIKRDPYTPVQNDKHLQKSQLSCFFVLFGAHFDNTTRQSGNASGRFFDSLLLNYKLTSSPVRETVVKNEENRREMVFKFYLNTFLKYSIFEKLLQNVQLHAEGFK